MTRPRLLVINPNTAEDITERIHQLALEEVGGSADVVSVTARFGARYISDRASAAIAAHAVLDAGASAANDGQDFDAVVIACFGDPGLEALGELVRVPVVGFAEAGIRAAAREPGRFLIATFGESWRGMLTDLVAKLGLSARLAGFAVLGDGDREPEAAARLIEATAARLGARRAVLGGTGLIPLIPAVMPLVTLPLLDPHRIALREAVARARRRDAPAPAAARAAGSFSGLSAALTRALEHTPRSDLRTI